MKHPGSLFRRLQWKLTLSYTFITVATLLVLELIIILVSFELTAANLPQIEIDALQRRTPELVPYLLTTPPDRSAAMRWLAQTGQIISQTDISQFPHIAFTVSANGLMAIVDRLDRVVAAQGDGAPGGGLSLAAYLPAAGQAVLQAALAGQTCYRQLTAQTPDGILIAAYPVLAPGKGVIGALLARTIGMTQGDLLLATLVSTLVLALPIVIPAIITGTVFGFFTARSFLRRFKRLSAAVDQWSQGNFSLHATDHSDDELGQVIHQLNQMAGQLQAMLQARQQIALLEERQRLARDLHDSMKQQIFAISMLVNSARRMLGHDNEQARTSLNEVDELVQQVQQELTALVYELHPVALNEKGLAATLQEFIQRWSLQTGMAVDVQVYSEPTLSHPLSEALFRIVQEALTNTARHSRASVVQVTLAGQQESMTLSICDNGQGFDVASVQGNGVGLVSMRERMKALGGTLLIESAPGEGARITASYRSQPDR